MNEQTDRKLLIAFILMNQKFLFSFRLKNKHFFEFFRIFRLIKIASRWFCAYLETSKQHLHILIMRMHAINCAVYVQEYFYLNLKFRK